MKPGDVVIDSEDDSPDRAVVLCERGSACEIEAYDGKTVAETNEDYPEDAEVVDVAFMDDLEPGWRTSVHVENPDVDTYSFPVPRLTLVGEDCGYCGVKVPRLYAHLVVCHSAAKHHFPDDGICPVCQNEYKGVHGLITHGHRAHDKDMRLEQ